jgi:hypothetical protein
VTPTAYAIQLAHRARHETTDVWAQITARLGPGGAREVLRVVTRAAVVDTRGATGDRRWALDLLARQNAVESWAASGFPLAVLSDEVAMELAHTDPPGALLSSPHGVDEWSTLGVAVGKHHFRLVTNWRSADSIAFAEPLRLQERDVRRLVTNVGFTLLERPVGLPIRELRPNPAVMHERGFLAFPGVAYIIQPPRRPRDAEDDAFVREITTPCGGMTVRTLVRGHWRMQAHGPGNSRRKPIWIRPAWRGPVDAPISIHATRITGSARDGEVVRRRVRLRPFL